MATLYVCKIEDGVCTTFTNVSRLREWLQSKNFEAGSPEAFTEWLESYFENGNEISVHGEHYSFLDCLELV